MGSRKRPVAALTALAALLLIGVIVAPTPGTTGDGGTRGAARRPKAQSHVAVIVLENHEYDEVIGNPSAAFLNGLARRGALATRYFAVTHPSLPNYLALLGGSTFGITDNCVDCRASGNNLALQLSRRGISWRAYMEDMPGRCFLGAESGDYVKRHNPFAYFPSIADRPGRCSHIVPATALDSAIRNRHLPRFAWITPDLCSGGHDCGIDVVDRYLARIVPRLTRKLGRGGFLVVTFDEGSTDRGCCGAASGGGRVMTLLAGPAVRRGGRLKRKLGHYSLLATLEDHFGLPRLRNARGARSLNVVFR